MKVKDILKRLKELNRGEWESDNDEDGTYFGSEPDGRSVEYYEIEKLINDIEKDMKQKDKIK